MPSDIKGVTKALADKYAIERELGRGGMATVYLAHDLKHNRPVAIKVLHPEIAVIVGAERFLQEIEVTANLQHPHILPLFDSGTAGQRDGGTGIPYYVMPFVEGETLRDRIDRDGPLPIEDALSILGDVAAALTYAHARGVIHRDIKPDNILLEDGEALVADFGIAFAVSSVDHERLTATGLSIGTPAYMSPEQIGGEAMVDGRSDEYALACVLYEMLIGEPPFTGPNAQSIIAQALTDPPPSVRARRPEVLNTIDAAIDTALAKNPDDRFVSPREFYESCQPLEPRKQARSVAGVVAVVVGALAIVGAVMGWRTIQVSNARASLLRIGELAESGEYVEAYDLALEAEGLLPDDSVLAALMSEVSARITITSDPPGADVYLRAYTEDGASSDSVWVGVTPLEGYRVPAIDHRVTLTLDGYAPATRIVTSAWVRSGRAAQERGLEWAIPLLPLDQQPSDMVFVPGGTYDLVSPDAILGMSTVLAAFLFDRFEVTNEAFDAFRANGGYSSDEYWGDVPEDARRQLVDRTGLPGPRSWSSQTFPEGRDRHPVTDVTWFEAQAYCNSVGKRLPTVYEWEKTARDGVAARTGIVMPWGLMNATGPTVPRANFNGTGTTAVDAFPFGVSAYGASDMAGNVKEWLANPMGDGYVVTGGSWEDPAYLHTEYGEQSAMLASPALGFRCARTVGESGGDQGGERFRFDERTPVYKPVSEAEFQSFLAYYRYDRRPSNPRFDGRVETPVWIRERIWIDGVDGDSVLAYFYSPRKISPPYQTLLYVGSSSVFCCETLPEQIEWAVGPVIQGGRAVLGVVLKGMVERPWPNHEWPAPNTVQFRDEMVLHATETRLGLDYLETRNDIDMQKIVYLSVSFGGGSRLPFSAVDDRYAAVIYIGGGIDERVKPTLPEADNVNFAPYVSVPKLLLNGRQDEEHPWFTRALPLWNLLREPKELVLVDGAGHVPPLEARIPAIIEFLDTHLGPVRR